MRNLKKQACGASSAGFAHVLIYFWFLLVGLSGSVIFNSPSATNGAMYRLVRLPMSLYPKNAAISFFDLAVEQNSMILLEIGSWWFSWWLASEFTPGPTLAVANGFSFAEIDSDIVVDLLNSNEEYAALSEQMSVMRKQHPFILNLDEGDGAITLSAEEHEAYLAYIGLMHQTEDMERLQIYFRGHTDAVAYLKKIKAI